MSSSDYGIIIQIGDILVSEEVVLEYFACDYEVCRGACCIVGDSGAPLEEGEIDGIERNYRDYSTFMGEKAREKVDAAGFFEVDRDGDIVTPLVPDSGECVYCHFGPCGDCLCAIETSGHAKPVSCSLYPIRVTKLSGGGQALNLHRWEICAPAFEKGRKDGTRVYQFLRRAITEAYGEDFYAALDAASIHFKGR